MNSVDILGFLTSEIGYQVTVDQVIGTFFGIICVWLTVRQNIWSWPTGLLTNLFFGLIFVRGHLYADLVLQGIYVVLGFYGWYEWLYGGSGKTELKVSTTPKRVWVMLATLALISIPLFAYGFTEAARMIGIPEPSVVYWDSATMVGCLVAQWMLAKKYLENWIIWIATNISYIALYLYKGLPLLSGLQIIFIILSVQGFYAWKKSYSDGVEDLSSVSSCLPIEDISI